jgi:hypothetical protein
MDSYAQFSKWAILLARTDASGPKHQGLTYFVFDMQGAGVTIRPLKQITGSTEFSEVFLDGAFVPDDGIIGRVGDGWTIAMHTLAHERGTGFAFKEQVLQRIAVEGLRRLARERGHATAPTVRQAIAAGWIDVEIMRLLNCRTLTRLERGLEPGPESSLVKLFWASLTSGCISWRSRSKARTPSWWPVGIGGDGRGGRPSLVTRGRNRRRDVGSASQHHRAAHPRLAALTCYSAFAWGRSLVRSASAARRREWGRRWPWNAGRPATSSTRSSTRSCAASASGRIRCIGGSGKTTPCTEAARFPAGSSFVTRIAWRPPRSAVLGRRPQLLCYARQRAQIADGAMPPNEERRCCDAIP